MIIHKNKITHSLHPIYKVCINKHILNKEVEYTLQLTKDRSQGTGRASARVWINLIKFAS